MISWRGGKGPALLVFHFCLLTQFVFRNSTVICCRFVWLWRWRHSKWSIGSLKQQSSERQLFDHVLFSHEHREQIQSSRKKTRGNLLIINFVHFILICIFVPFIKLAQLHGNVWPYTYRLWYALTFSVASIKCFMSLIKEIKANYSK